VAATNLPADESGIDKALRRASSGRDRCLLSAGDQGPACAV